MQAGGADHVDQARNAVRIIYNFGSRDTFGGLSGDARVDELEKLLEHLGYGTPIIYGAAAYGLFAWLDGNISDEGKVVLANTMKLKDADNKQIASALVEVFDRVYAYPLFRWRAFFRSALFTLAVTVVYLYETNRYGWDIPFVGFNRVAAIMVPSISFNIFTDYISLFLIRRLLSKGGARPILALAGGAAIGVMVVAVANVARSLFIFVAIRKMSPPSEAIDFHDFVETVWSYYTEFSFLMWPATVVFAWLLLFAVGILVARGLSPVSGAITTAQWLLKDGKEHPLKAVGFVAAPTVFATTAAWLAIFNA